jgi:hypothetical protein
LVSKNGWTSLGFRVSLGCTLSAAVNPLIYQLLKDIQTFFGGIGHISISDSQYQYEVNSLESLSTIRDHFLAYPLQPTKIIHFQLWRTGL